MILFPWKIQFDVCQEWVAIRTGASADWFTVDRKSAADVAKMPHRFEVGCRVITLKSGPRNRRQSFPHFFYRRIALEAAMKCIFAALFAMFVQSIIATHVVAHDIPLQERINAVQELEQAKADLRSYWLVEYPRKLRELDAAIEMTEKEIASNKSLAREYRPFNRFSTGNPFPITLRNLELCARSAELRLDSLRKERNNMVRFHSDQIRALTARMAQARARLQAIDAAIAANVTAVEP